jgi:hypothetical protein
VVRRRAERVVALGAAVGALAVVGCQAVLGLGDLSPADAGAASDAKTTADASHDAGARDASRPDARFGDATMNDGTAPGKDGGDASTDGGDCPIVYVANSVAGASDSNSGCSTAHPKLTIAAAMLAQHPGGQVWVCEGMYTEIDLNVTSPISLHGGYECSSSTWTRPATWGYPHWSSATSITNSTMSVAAHFGTLSIGTINEITDAEARIPFTVDGFLIYGGSIYPTSYAVTIHNGFSPDLSNNHIIGGTLPTATPETDVYAAALFIGEAAPDVSLNRIEFTGPVVGPAIGVFVLNDGTRASAAHIHANTILAGDGTGSAAAPDSAGSIGVAFVTAAGSDPAATQFTLAAGAALEDNTITAGVGLALPGKLGAIGVYADGNVRVDMVGNAISGGVGAPITGADAGLDAPISAGIAIYGGANVEILGNNIYGGQQAAGQGGTVGVLVSSSTGVIANNMIHGGSIASADPAVVTKAISMNHTDAAVVEDNTLYAGGATFANAVTGWMYALDLTTSRNVIVRGNILGTPGVLPTGVNVVSLNVDDCAEIGALEGNLFIGNSNAANPLKLLSSQCHPGADAAPVESVKAVEGLLAGASVRKNLVSTQACDAVDVDAGLCAGDCPTSGCMPSLVNNFASTAANGVLDVDAGSWTLRDGSACAITTGGVNLAPAVTTDIADAARPTDGSSMGAWQYQGKCP